MSLKTLFIWEGVTMYIDQAAVDRTLAFVANNSGEGSSIVFDFTYPDVIEGSCERKEAVEWLKKANSGTEPLVFGIAPEKIESFLTERGFSQVTCVSSDFFNETYFTELNEGRLATRILSITMAMVS